MLRHARTTLAFAMTGLISSTLFFGCAEDVPPGSVDQVGLADGAALDVQDGALAWHRLRRICRADRDCGRAGTCDKASCDAEFGLCVVVPTACPDVWQPECGCDGKTYSNVCERRAARVDLAHSGECEQRCDGIAGLQCSEGQVCQHPAGECDIADGAGVCVPAPEGCPRVWAPVCGCDGETYGNECLALAAGVSIDHAGECVKVCVDNDACGDGEYCAHKIGECGGQGVCEPRPQVCPLFYQPVCGCNGKTYGNTCEAASSGVTVSHEGACEIICDGFAGVQCPDGQFCDHPAETCDVADQQGVCVEQAEICPRFWWPVCGCDGKTYGNDCERVRAGQQEAHEGECEVAACHDNAECQDDEWCARPTCDGAGVCEQRPTACPDVWTPMCGCDGKTYGNRCEASAAGVPVAHEGECQTICGGLIGASCEGGEFCDPFPGECDVADGQGVCVLQSQVCTALYRPVCGCNGKTYSNDCVRIGSGVGKDHDGVCECAPVACDIYCQYGYVTDADGCDTCACNPAPECPPLCDNFCPYGHKVDEQGCELCACNPEPTCCEASRRPECPGDAVTCCDDGRWSCDASASPLACVEGDLCPADTTPE